VINGNEFIQQMAQIFADGRLRIGDSVKKEQSVMTTSGSVGHLFVVVEPA
jgi:hypothetical protein